MKHIIQCCNIFYKCVEYKKLETDPDKKDKFPDMDEDIKYMKPNPKLFENNKFVNFFSKAFPIIENETPELKKKEFSGRMLYRMNLRKN